MANRRDTRSYSDTETSTFAKMGDEELTSHLVNVSGNRSPYTMPVGRKGPKTDQDQGVGTAAHRSQNLIHEANGPQAKVVATIDYSNAPEKSSTGRGMRTVPSKAGISDFSSPSSEGQVIG